MILVYHREYLTGTTYKFQPVAWIDNSSIYVAANLTSSQDWWLEQNPTVRIVGWPRRPSCIGDFFVQCGNHSFRDRVENFTISRVQFYDLEGFIEIPDRGLFIGRAPTRLNSSLEAWMGI